MLDHDTGRHRRAVHHYLKVDEARAAWRQALEPYRRQDRDADVERVWRRLGAARLNVLRAISHE